MSSKSSTLVKRVSVVDLSFYLGVNERTIAKLVKKGVLHRQSDGNNFALAPSIASYIAYREQVATKEAGAAGPYAQARAAVTLERAALLRLQREKMEGTLINRAHHMLIVASANTIARMKITGRANALAARLANMSAADCYQILSTYDCETLEHLADSTDDDVRPAWISLAQAQGVKLHLDEQQETSK